MFFDYYYLILVVPTLILSLVAQGKVKYAFNKYSRIPTKARISGKEIAEKLMFLSNIQNVSIKEIQGSLTDHYDPTTKILRLSQTVFNKTSIAAVGVSAHEVGHAIQDKIGYAPLILRGTLVPIANIGSNFGPLLAIAGLIFGISIITNLGIILFSIAVLFYLITLPVEIDASRRALNILKETHLLSSDELYGIKIVLTAAAFTYIASALTAVASLIRLILLERDRRR